MKHTGKSVKYAPGFHYHPKGTEPPKAPLVSAKVQATPAPQPASGADFHSLLRKFLNNPSPPK